MPRPRVCLSLSTATPERAESHDYYRAALARAGADVIEVHPGDDPPGEFDALVLAGGGDIDPSHYAAANTDSADIDPQRDELELALARAAIARDIPTLGICRGFQVLNVAMGGALVQHVPGHRRATPDDPVVLHERVTPLAGSRLAAVMGSGPCIVNSSHHQAVTRAVLAPGLTATVELDGLIESFEATRARWVVGVQWHPERAHEVSAEATRVFDALVAEAARRPAAAVAT